MKTYLLRAGRAARPLVLQNDRSRINRAPLPSGTPAKCLLITKTLQSLCAAVIGPMLACGTVCLASIPSDPVLAWNETLGRFLATTTTPIPLHVEARAFAIIHLAIEQAVIAMEREPRPMGGDDSLERVAVAEAAREVLVSLWPAEAARFDAAAAAEIELAANGPEKNRAIEAGRAAATLGLHKREADGWLDATGALAPLCTDPSPSLVARLTRKPTSPWLTATPFILKSAEQFSARLPFFRDFDGEPQPDSVITRAKIFDTVDRSAPGTLMHFWSGSPVVVWNRIARVVVARAGLPLNERARIFAMVNVAIADATVSALHWRFMLAQWSEHWGTVWMPAGDLEMAGDIEATIDGTSATMMVRPERRRILSRPLPDYPSVAATVAGAAATALGSVTWAGKIGLELSGNEADEAHSVQRTYPKLSDAGYECAFAASLDGRHCREACVSGYHLGMEIGNYVLKQMRTRRR